MRVAFMVYSFPVVSQTFIVSAATGLIERGHDVDLFALRPRQPFRGPVHPAVRDYRLVERTHYLYDGPGLLGYRGARLSAVPQALRRTASPSGLLRQLMHCIRYGRRARSLIPLLLGARLASLPPYDIVHCQFGYVGFYAAMLRDMGWLPAKLVTTFRGFDISSYVQQHGPDAYELLFRSGDFFLSNCDYFGRRAIELGCDPGRIETHRSGIDTARFAFRPRRRAADDGELRIVSVGRMVEKKGFDYALQAIAAIASKLPDLRYTIAGDGPLRARLRARAMELGIGGRVSFVGALPQDRVIALLKNSDIFLGPSVRSDNGDEDAPINTVKEAMAVGLPVVATRHGGIPELVEDGVSGFLVPERDPDAIAERLRHLVAHPDRWPDMGLAGRRRVEADYDVERLNDTLVSIYARVLALPPRATIR